LAFSVGNGFTFIEPSGVNSINNALRSLSTAERALLQILVIEYDWREMARKMASLLLKDAWAQRGDYESLQLYVVKGLLARRIYKGDRISWN